MKALLTLFACAGLAACSSPSSDAPSSSAFPVTIPYLTSTVDPQNGQVEVAITIKSEFRESLKTVRVTVAAFDANGSQVSTADEVIEVLGPIVRGQSIGPLEKVTSIHNRSVACVKVTQIQAMKLDYTLDSVAGAQAQAAVTGGSQPKCNR